MSATFWLVTLAALGFFEYILQDVVLAIRANGLLRRPALANFCGVYNHSREERFGFGER